LALCGVAGCSRSDSSSELNAYVPDQADRVGDGFDPVTGENIGVQCVTGDIEVVAPKLGEAEFLQDVSAQKIIDKLNASGDAELNFSGDGLKLSGALEFAKEVEESQFAATYVVRTKFDMGHARLENAKLKDSYATVPEKDYKTRMEICGSQYLQQVDLAAQFIGVIKVEFANAQQKRRFKGNLQFNWGDGGGDTSVDIKGQVDQLVDNAKEFGKVSIHVRQFGGKGHEIASAISGEIVDCNANTSDSLTACKRAAQAMLHYATNTFKKQFEDEQGNLDYRAFWLSNRKYVNYKTLPNDQWAVDPPDEAIVEAVKLNRHRITAKVLDEYTDYYRADALATASFADDAIRETARDIQDTIAKRMIEYAKALKVCRNLETVAAAARCIGGEEYVADSRTGNTTELPVTKDDQPVKHDGALKMLELTLKGPEMKYDVSKLVILPTKFSEYCELVGQWWRVYVPHATRDRANIVSGADNSTRITYRELVNHCGVQNRLDSSCAQSPPKMKLTLDPESTDCATTRASESRDKKLFCPGVVRENKVSHLDMDCGEWNSNVNSIEMLDLKGKNIEAIEPIATIKYLKTLDLSGNYPTSLLPLLKLNRLETINLSDAKLGPEQFRDLFRHKLLKHITLAKAVPNEASIETGEVDDILRHVYGMRFLKSLDLSENADLGVAARLSSMKDMRSLETLILTKSGFDLEMIRAQLQPEFLDEQMPKLKSIIVSCDDEISEVGESLHAGRENPVVKCKI
jgi:hypothetical protein